MEYTVKPLNLGGTFVPCQSQTPIFFFDLQGSLDNCLKHCNVVINHWLIFVHYPVQTG